MIIYYIHEGDEYMYKNKNHPPILLQIGGDSYMIKRLKDLIDNYKIFKESKKLANSKSITSIGTEHHLNVIDI